MSDWAGDMAARSEQPAPVVDEVDADVLEGDRFANLGEFVELYVVELYSRDLQGMKHLRWCEKWWLHAEALTRLHAMWRAFELLRLDKALGMSDWLLGHADPHMRVLLSEEGPFRQCREAHGRDGAIEPLKFTTPAESGEDRFWERAAEAG